MDMCKNCKYVGNLEECEETNCELHECWIIKELQNKIKNIIKEK